MRALSNWFVVGWTFVSVGTAGAATGVPRNSDGRPFVHPGIFYTQGDLDRMRAMVAAGQEPWARTFAALKASRFSDPAQRVPTRGGKIESGQFNGTIGLDGRRAHDLALLWKLTDDPRYADKARDFLVQNAKWTAASGRGTAPLDNGKIHLLIEAAELLRDYPGWAVDDQARFKQTLRTVFYPHIMTGDAMRWGNQGLTAYHAVLAMAVYLDDRKMYDRVWNYLLGLPHRPDDAPYTPGGDLKPGKPVAPGGPSETSGDCLIACERSKTLGTVPDWGYDEQLRYYIYANGQGEEACRDQPHALYGLFKMVSLAEVFWNQGDDFYGALDNRILLGLEWALRYNLSDWEPKGYTKDESAATFDNGLFYQATTRNERWIALKPSPKGRGTDGGSGAPRMAAFMHYAVRRGLPPARVNWLMKAVNRTLVHDGKDDGFENCGVGPNWFYEWEGWGTLTKMRTPWQKGDPGTWKKGRRISGAHAVPGKIKVSDHDFLLGRRGSARDYTLSVPHAGRYRLTLNTPVPQSTSLAVRVDGRPMKFGILELPAGAPVLQLATPVWEWAENAELLLESVSAR